MKNIKRLIILIIIFIILIIGILIAINIGNNNDIQKQTEEIEETQVEGDMRRI